MEIIAKFQLYACLMGLSVFKPGLFILKPIGGRKQQQSCETIRKNLALFKINIPSNIQLIGPQGYLDFINLQMNAAKIITDSGGIQKEAYIMEKPYITLRSETEWVETVENGWNNLVDIYIQAISEEIRTFEPAGFPVKVFGKNVRAKMGSIINGM